MTISTPKLQQGDCAVFEGKELAQIVRVETEGAEHRVTFHLISDKGDGSTSDRAVTEAEFEHLLRSEKLVIRWSGSLTRSAADRNLMGRKVVAALPRRRREAAFRKAFLADLVQHLNVVKGMPLTEFGISEFIDEIREADQRRQRLMLYGTEHSRPSQALQSLPSLYTLLKYRRQFYAADQDPNCFSANRTRPCDRNDTTSYYEALTLGTMLQVIRENPHVSVQEIADITKDSIRLLREEQVAKGVLDPIKVLSVGSYRRRFKENIDVFWYECIHNGIKFAREKFQFNDGGIEVAFPGERVEFDTWNVHISTLDCSREAWLRMTEEERAKVPRVRRCIVIAIDTATRCIIGFCICESPTQEAALEALRMTAMDKTLYLEKIGITDTKLDQRCALISVVHDNGAEFGRNPFADSKFKAAVTQLSASDVATVAGVPQLRARIERLNRTVDAYFACHAPGWTGSGPHTLNGRKPELEACLTDDDLFEAFVAFIARYHRSEHRMLGMSPDDKWRELTSAKSFDDRLPGPEQLRLATGRHEQLRISKDGIVFDGVPYINEKVRKGRYGRPGDKVEIIRDRFDMGAISVLHCGVAEPVPALEDRMHGVHHAEWQLERQHLHVLRKQRKEDGEAAKSNARRTMKKIIESAAAVAGQNLSGPSDEAIEYERRALEMGKGKNERPFVSELDPDPISESFDPSGELGVNGGPHDPGLGDEGGEPVDTSEAGSRPADKKKKRLGSRKWEDWRASPDALRKG